MTKEYLININSKIKQALEDYSRIKADRRSIEQYLYYNIAHVLIRDSEPSSKEDEFIKNLVDMLIFEKVVYNKVLTIDELLEKQEKILGTK